MHTLSIHFCISVFTKAFLSLPLGCLPETLNCSSSRFLYSLTPRKKFVSAIERLTINYTSDHGRFISAAYFLVQPLCWIAGWRAGFKSRTGQLVEWPPPAEREVGTCACMQGSGFGGRLPWTSYALRWDKESLIRHLVSVHRLHLIKAR